MIVFALVGVVETLREEPINAMPAVFVVGFYIYHVVVLVPFYFMWYIPPVAAIVWVYAGIGLKKLFLRTEHWALAFGVVVALMYAVHIPFTFVLESRVQHDIEYGVRREVGRELNNRMEGNDTVVLEPLGYIGWEAFNKTIYDYPGLSSQVVTDTLSALESGDRTMTRLAAELLPDYLVFRPGEWNAFVESFPEESDLYYLAADFVPLPGLDLTFWGLSYFSIDVHFGIYERGANNLMDTPTS